MSIERTFRDLADDEELEQLSLLSTWGWSGAFGWPELLKSDRVLVVSEAGAGKTYECRAQRDSLWDAGEAAFYLDLAALNNDNLRDLLSADEETRLDNWLTAQSDVATFFLDSIDELELTLGNFENALKRFGKAIAGHLGRARIVITTRPIPVDQQIFRTQLPIPPKAEDQPTAQSFADVAMRRGKKDPKDTKKPPEWRNVALMPLSNAQILEMATIQKVEDPEALLADIVSRNAEEFARRPQDLIELCVDWRDNRRIRNHAGQVAHNIEIKLKPRTDRAEKAQLAEDKALDGARRLALAALLTRKLTIRHSAEADKEVTADAALDPAAILPDWTAEERATLLERPLFGFATYGRVRFHHRSVVEFLAAERLDARLHAGMSMKSVKRLLFADTSQGERVVRPSMQPVAAWLAGRQGSIFSELLNIEPSVLLDFGDPASLSRQQRRLALRGYVERYGTGGWRGLQAPGLQVRRFASTELSQEVQRLWTAGIENAEVRSLLLDLIGAAQMADCADIAHGVATDDSLPENERIDAVDALIALNDERLPRIVSSIQIDRKLWSNRLARLLIPRLFPRHMTAKQLCEALKTLTARRTNVGDLTGHLPYTIAEADLSRDEITELRRGLAALVIEGARWNAQLHQVEISRHYLIPALTAACMREWREGQPFHADLLEASVWALRLPEREYDPDNRVHELRVILSQRPAADRERAFWIDDRLLQELHPQTDYWNRLAAVAIHDGHGVNYDQDWGWISAALADVTRPIEERHVMLQAAFLTSHGEAWRDQLEALRPAVQDHNELLAALDKRVEPAKRNPDLERMRRENAKRQKQAERRQAKDHASWVQFWQEIANNPDEIFGEKRAQNTAWNLWTAMDRYGSESRASGWKRRFIEGHFGKEVADRLRETLMRAWRNDRPTLRSERKADQKGTYLIRWQLGVAAIAAESEDPQWAEKLSHQEAELAARFAPIELNGFPSWLGSLAAAHPKAVDAVIGEELSRELSELAVSESYSMLLQDISHATPEVASSFLPRLRDWLDRDAGAIGHNEDQTVGAERLSRVIEIILKHGEQEAADHIRQLAQDQLEKGTFPAFTRVWLPTLMRLAPSEGITRFERILDTLPIEREGEAVRWFASLFGERHRTLPVDLRKPGFSAPLLLRLVRLAYQHVQFTEDLRHEGSYSPGLRDNAQDARNAILNALLATKGPEAWSAKLQLAEDPLCAHLKDRLFALARERAAEEVDDIAFDYSQIAALDKQGEAAPATRDSMFALMRDRLDDLDDILLQDTSPREGWASFDDERVLRRAIAHEFRNMSNDAYKIDQEAVTADEKETDIRLRSTGGPQEATIELKIGEKNRSARELRETLREQLVKKYMAAEACRSGCLLISVASDRTWHHPDTAQQIGLGELIAMLNDEADKIVLEMGGEIRLTAKGLDLRPRLSPERKRKKKG